MTEAAAHLPDDDRPQDVEAELEQILREAEESVAGLRRELQERRRHARQHAEIDRLDQHLAATRPRWRELRAFIDEVVSELREGTRHDG